MNDPGPLRSSERGSVLVLVVVAMVVLLGITAVAVDLGVLYFAAQQTQHAADVAALAGAGKLRDGMSVSAAQQEAIRLAAENAILRDPVTVATSDVLVGAWDAPNHQVIAWDPTATEVAVQVTVRRTRASNNPVPTFFARVLGIQSMNVTRTAVAGVFVNQRPRNAVCLMVVQDGSSSFQGAWSEAVDADAGLLGLINGVSVTNDAAGMVTFNAHLDRDYLESQYEGGHSLWYYYRNNPEWNAGIKHTTNNDGVPVRTTETGVPSPSGVVRPMAGDVTEFDIHDHTQLPTALDNATQLSKNGNAWGDTDTAAGLNYAIDHLVDGCTADPTEKVIVLVSDGMPHSVNGWYATEALKRAATTAANRAADEGIRIHTVTLEGTNGVNFAFNESLIRNGGYAFRAANANNLFEMLISVGAMEVGRPTLLR